MYKVLSFFALVFFMSSCEVNEFESSSEDSLLQVNSIKSMLDQQNVVLEIAMVNRLSDITDNKDLSNAVERLMTKIQIVNSENPNLDVARLLSKEIAVFMTSSSIITIEDDISAFATPCTDAFNTSMVAVTASVTIGVASGAAAVPSIAAYTIGLAAATANWCACMESNYDEPC